MTIAEPTTLFSLDIGTSKIVLLASEVMPDGTVTVLGKAESESFGYERGSVTNFIQLSNTLKNLRIKLEAELDMPIKSVIASVSTRYIHSIDKKATCFINQFVTEEDIENTLLELSSYKFDGYTILHLLSQEYQIDNLPPTKDPYGLRGRTLTTNAHFIVGNTDYLTNISNAIHSSGVEVSQFVYSGVADAYDCLTEDEKEMGVCLINIGAGSLNVLVYTDASVRYSRNIPFGGDDVTEHIAKKYLLSLKEAERIKKYGAAINERNLDYVTTRTIDERDIHITLEDISKLTSRCYGDLLVVVREELKQLLEFLKEHNVRNKLMAGVVLTGGCSNIRGIKECANEVFNMPVRVASLNKTQGLTDLVNSPAYSTARGLLKYEVLNYAEEVEEPDIFDKVINVGKAIYNFFKDRF